LYCKGLLYKSSLYIKTEDENNNPLYSTTKTSKAVMSTFTSSTDTGGGDQGDFADWNLLAQFAQVDRTTKWSDLHGHEIFLILGNTGAGKSTFTNYVIGQRMREAAVQGSLQKGFVRDDAVVEIGHGFESKTEFPHTVYDRGADITYCDCPGFLDTRSALHDISNAYGIAKVAKQAGSIKGVVYVMSYHALLADRGQAIQAMAVMLNKLFGENGNRHTQSIMLLVTKVPVDVSLDMLREHMLENTSLTTMLREIVLQMQMYDPLDRHCASGCLNRADLTGAIRRFVPFSGEDFCFSISPSATQEVVKSLCAQRDDAFSGHGHPMTIQILSSHRVSSFVKRLMNALDKLSVFNSGAIQEVQNGVTDRMRNCLVMISRVTTRGATTPLPQQLNQLQNLKGLYPRFTACIDDSIGVVEAGIQYANETRLKEEQLAAEKQRLKQEALDTEKRRVAAEQEHALAIQMNQTARANRERAEREERSRLNELEASRRRLREQAQTQQVTHVKVECVPS
jgi:hypothetical protein